MNILYLLVGASLLAALVFLGVFIWAVKSGQYEDTYSSSVRILFDDEETLDDADEKEPTENKGEIDKEIGKEIK